MKKAVCMLLLCFLLSGCGSVNSEMDRAVTLRQALLQNGCEFETYVTADYETELFYYAVRCRTDATGDVSFQILEPETIADISGKIETLAGKLIFEDTAVAFPLMADGQLTPVTAPWILVKALRSGYISACGMDGELVRIVVNDSYEENALRLDVWVNTENIPVKADVFWNERRILSMDVKSFSYL